MKEIKTNWLTKAKPAYSPKYLDIIGDKVKVRIKMDDPSLENFRRAMIELAKLKEGNKIMKKYGIEVII